MKKRVTGALLTGTIALSLFAQGDASTDGKTRSFVYTNNNSVDWVFVSAFGVQQTLQANIATIVIGGINDIGTGLAISGPLPTDSVQGSWCVAPKTVDHHGLTAVIHSVRIEARTGKNCDPNGQATTSAKPGIATVSGGGSGAGNEPGGPASIVENVPITVTESRGASQ